MSKTLRNWIIVLGLGLIVWICPTPEGLTPKAWHLFAIFIATIAGFILQPISMGAVAFLALTFCAVTGVLTFQRLYQDRLWKENRFRHH